MDIITMHSLFLHYVNGNRVDNFLRYITVSLHVHICPAGLNPDPGTMNFPILGEVYMEIMDHTMHLLFYQIYMEVEKKTF